MTRPRYIDRDLLGGTVPDRFWNKVDILEDEDACWNWNANKLPRGYGQFRLGSIKDGMFLAHRIAFALANSDNPYININPEVVMHKCDNTSCCNPRHLIPGTVLSNVQDMISKGRAAPGEQRALKGSLNKSAKLNEDKVLEIRNLSQQGIINARLAEMFGVSRVLIGRIVRNLQWRHVNAV